MKAVTVRIFEYVKQLIAAGVDSEEWKFWIIQWVAESLTPAIKVRKRNSDRVLRCKAARLRHG